MTHGTTQVARIADISCTKPWMELEGGDIKAVKLGRRILTTRKAPEEFIERLPAAR